MLKFYRLWNQAQCRLYSCPSPKTYLPVCHSKPSRLIQTSSFHPAKLFIDNENRYAHKILQANDRYKVVWRQPEFEASTSTNQLEEPFAHDSDWSNVTHSNVIKHMQWIVNFCQNNSICISDTRFDKFVDHFTQVCFDLNDQDLIQALRILAQVPETDGLNTRNFVELWSALDDACVERIMTWDADTILLVCDHWYVLNLGKVNRFNWNAIKKLGRKLRKVDTHHLVQTMFYCNLLRSPVVEMIDFEMGMAQRIDQMSLDEISVMCMGFFKTQTCLKSVELINEIYRRLIAEMDTVQDISFTNILKALRYSSRLPHVEPMTKLLDRIVPEIPRMSLMTCLHILLLGTDIHVCHNATIEPILYRFVEEVPNIRLKELERISFVMGLYNLQPIFPIADRLSRSILVELKTRVEEIMRYPRCFPSCLHFLSFGGYADEELISSVLDEQFCLMAYGRNVTLGRELFALDAYARINLKDSYKGHLLVPKRRGMMGKILVHYIPRRDGEFKLSATDKILLEIKEAVERGLGDCHMAHVLPHFDRPDVILAYDRRTERLVDVSTRYPEHYSGRIITKATLIEAADAEHIVFVNIIIAGWNNYVRSQDRLIGLIEQKRLQSRLIGMRPIVVPWFEWTRLTKQEQTIYMRQKVDEVVKE